MNPGDTSWSDTERRPICSTSGKVIFSKKDALTKKNYLMKIGRERNLRAYECEDCGWWHLTKNKTYGNGRK